MHQSKLDKFICKRVLKKDDKPSSSTNENYNVFASTQNGPMPGPADRTPTKNTTNSQFIHSQRKEKNANIGPTQREWISSSKKGDPFFGVLGNEQKERDVYKNNELKPRVPESLLTPLSQKM